MTELEDGAVSLTVTSPPYWNAIDYRVHAIENTQWYRTRKYTVDYDGYIEWLHCMFREVYRVTKPGGFCVVVIGTLLLNGKMYPLPSDFTTILCSYGWLFHQDIIWHKVTGGVKRAGVTIQHPYPGYYYPNIMTEYILVFRKDGPKIYKGRYSDEREQAQVSINKLFTMDIANNIWHIAPVPPKVIDHPCPFPEEIPHRLISLYSYCDELVLDPFVGSGQTTKVAHYLGRQFVGYDNIKKYVDLATSRLDEPPAIRLQQLYAKFENIGLDEPCKGTK